MIIETSKKFNMPKENVERAIKKGTGEIEGVKYEEIMYEAYGPHNVAIIIEGITDNKNRTLGEIKQILSQYNGKLADNGSVKWMFERKGVISVQLESNAEHIANKDELELKAIDSGAEDISWQDNTLNIYTQQDDLEKIKKNLENQKIEIESASLDWLAKEEISLDENHKESIEKLFEALDENDDVQEIFSNLKS
jgi:YebC/PmpR family DNA-binding regulatory protein